MKSIISSRAAALSLALLASFPMVWNKGVQAAVPTAGSVTEAAPDSTVISRLTLEGKTIEVTLGQLKEKIKFLPPQLQNVPLEVLFPLLQKNINIEQILCAKAEKAGIQNKPEYLKMVEECKKGVLQKIYFESEVNRYATEEELRKEYNVYVKENKNEKEYSINIVSFKNPKTAEKALKDLNNAGTPNFGLVSAPSAKDNKANSDAIDKINEILKTHVKDVRNLDYIRLDEMPEEFRIRVQKATPASLIQEVIAISMSTPDSKAQNTTYHLIYVQDIRDVTIAEFEKIKEELKARILPKLNAIVISGVEKEAKIDLFTIQGKPFVPNEDKKPEPASDSKKPDDKAAGSKADTSKGDDKKKPSAK